MRESIPGYGLARPTMADAAIAVRRAFGPRAADMWGSLLAAAGLAGDEADDAALDRMLDAMPLLDPVCAVLARGMRVRTATYDHLAAAQAPARGAHQRPDETGITALPT
jgi:hypothetical protein